MSQYVDYNIGKTFINSFMIDECLITRDVEGVSDDTLDLDTGLLDRPFEDAKTVYTGPCLIRAGTSSSNSVVGELEIDQEMYKILLPLEIINVRKNDLIFVTQANNDPKTLNKLLKISVVDTSTNKTYRSVYAKDITMFPQQGGQI